MGFYRDNANAKSNWNVENLPINRSFVWYKTTFKSPLGDDPVVVDLLGLDKGTTWVNGHNIGQYWPSYLAVEEGCDSPCDCRGKYNPNKCLTNCGKSSQLWYHIPRSFLCDEGYKLVLLEEFGGNPSLVNVQTVTVGKACGNAYEGNTLEQSCKGGKVISEIRFASFGDPKAVVTCVGKESCVILASEDTFKPSGCEFLGKRLAVEADC
ncbi:unnamed protein product [Ilex paraguariensis]|uniref:Beta-galactosidase galactose-binding domain-containing protein n=1 Tax=Ilex paraguariensis TaxID=185542 RepID=A0ABC8RMR1_9AQUA